MTKEINIQQIVEILKDLTENEVIFVLELLKNIFEVIPAPQEIADILLLDSVSVG